MTKFEIVASPAREAVRAELDELCAGTEIFSKRRDYYTFQNPHGFQFVFITGLLFKPPAAHLQPMIAICHKDLARQFNDLKERSFFPQGRPHEKWEPPNFLHLYALRGRKTTIFVELDHLVAAASEEFCTFMAQTERFRSISDPKSLHRYLEDVDGIYGATGLLMEMFLDQFTNDKPKFVEKYQDRQLPPIHLAFYKAIIANYPSE